MEFLTQESLSGPGRPGCLSGWLRAAVASLAALESSQVILPTAQEWSARLVKNTVSAEQRHPTFLHSHGYGEVCIGVGGRALMEVEDGIYVLEAPSVFFAFPHTPHCQARTEDGAFQALIWLTLSQGKMLVITSAYLPGKGWSASARDSLQGEDVKNLSAAIQALEDGPDPATLETARAGLLDVMNRAYQRAARRELQGEDERAEARAPHKPVLDYVRTYIDNNLDTHVTLRELGEIARLSPNYLNCLFRQWTGQPLHHYMIRRRMETARQLLREGRLLVKQVARRVGYEDPLYFSRAFHNYYGEWPADVRD